jgi:hypothetical protein
MCGSFLKIQMKSDNGSCLQLPHALLAFSLALVCAFSQVAHAQPSSPQGSQAQESNKQPNPKDSNPSLPGDRSQVGGNDVLKPMTIEQQKAEAQKKSELVDLQKKAYEHAVENMLEAVD